MRPLVDLFDAGDAGHFFDEVAFDAHLQGHGGRWAADAGPEELDENRAIGADADQFEVAAIYTEGRVVHEDLELAVRGRSWVRGAWWSCGVFRSGRIALHMHHRQVDRDGQ